MEKNYGSVEDEYLPVLWAASHFRSYLFENSFTLITDHEPLKWIMTTQKLTGKLARWGLLMRTTSHWNIGQEWPARALTASAAALYFF